MPVLVALVGGRQPSGLCPGHDVAIIVRVALIRSFLFLHPPPPPPPELHEAYADWSSPSEGRGPMTSAIGRGGTPIPESRVKISK